MRLVRAAPGSGKTWLVAEAIRDELAHWSTGAAGIAALSFTRVGGDEIRQTLGRDLGHPHFVGTLDAFVFRYIVRPHLRGVFPEYSAPILVPGEWEPDRNWHRNDIPSAANPKIRINPFACVWRRSNGARPSHVLAQKKANSGRYELLDEQDQVAVIKRKKELWRSRGLITHSDAAYLASAVLRDSSRGQYVCEAIARRFSLVVVDELQDTGRFLTETIFALLRSPRARGLLVGDPDQAIYEFTGATPQLFSVFAKLDGATELALASSRRCPKAIATVACHFKESEGPLHPAEHGPGRAFLVRYNDASEIAQVVRVVLASRVGGAVKVVVRSNSTLRLLAGVTGANPVSLGCRPATALQRGVQALRRGRSVAALAAGRTAIELVMFDRDGVSDDEVREAGYDPRRWKALAVRCLLRANTLPTTGSVYEWQIGAHAILEHELAAFSLAAGCRQPQSIRKPNKRGDFAKEVRAVLPDPSVHLWRVEGTTVQTVHAVKGETHDATVFVCPPTKGKAGARKCPSALWWSADALHAEERRIAYVATTRSREDLILCVDEPSFSRLSRTQATFVATLQTVTVHELETALAPR
ncbi:MAG: ATP-dependent helicase [Gemmatimonadetes bacterium]|nr:ATP-dependent helicase [Gemmatimonadota bacterium]MCC6769724.1 ATP-dependent helicase [Gemmatimonadaceae bacterium]